MFENYSILMTIYKGDNPKNAQISIDSMLNQTIRANDFVLVCDGDLTAELNLLINKYEQTYPDLFNVIRLKQNVGLGAALRIGVNHCKNEFIARMDDDDIAMKDRCEIELQFMKDHPNIDLLGSNVSEFDDDPEKPLRIKKMPIGYDNIKKFAKRRNPFNHSTVMFKKSVVLNCGNYSQMRTNQDVDLWIRMINHGCVCENIDKVLVAFRFDRGTLERRKNWTNAKLLIKVWKTFYDEGYCTYFDYLLVKFQQIAIYMMPSSILNWVYNNLR